MDDLVEFLEERHRLKVFIAAEAVRNTLSWLSGIIQVQQGGHGVHAQGVKMVLLQPEERAVQQKVFDLDTPEIKDAAMPFGMVPQAWVGVVVELRAVNQARP